MRGWLTTVLLIPWLPLVAQTPIRVSGVVTNGTTNAPVPGAMVQLRDGGITRRVVTTDRMGKWFALVMPDARYTWRIIAMGYAPTAEARLDPAQAGERRVVMIPLAIRLPDINNDDTCGRIDGRSTYFTDVMKAAQASLETAERTARDGDLTFSYRGDHRALRPGTAPRLWQDTTTANYDHWPVPTASADAVRSTGFVGTSPDGERLWYGPSSEVIFSDWFMNSHCFRAIENVPAVAGRGGPRLAAIILLQFDKGTGSAPDISGTIRIERKTMAVISMAWEYRNLPEGDLGVAASTITFNRSDDGRWYPWSWQLTRPQQLRDAAGRPLAGSTGWQLVSNYTRLAIMAANRDSTFRP